MADDRCWADQIDVNVACELEPGHDGPHRCTFEWEATDSADFWTAATLLAIGVGYTSFLAQRYGVPHD